MTIVNWSFFILKLLEEGQPFVWLLLVWCYNTTASSNINIGQHSRIRNQPRLRGKKQIGI